jgi:uncharacterized OB-fold protein
MAVSILLPATDDPDSAGFWAATRERRFVVQKCESCGRLRFPPRSHCRACQSAKLAWVPMSGRGSIWSYAVAHKPVLPAFEPFAPFPIVIVALEEDAKLRIAGNVLAAPGAPINSVDPATLKIGQAVEVTYDKMAEDVMLPRWVIVK